MKVRQGGVPGVPCQVKGQDTITLVPHAPCHGDPEEELVTITTQAIPAGRQALNRVGVQALPGILVTDISTSALSDATLPVVPASDSTTTTTIPCVPHVPPKAPAALPWSRGVAAKQGRRVRARGTAPTHTSSSSRPAPVVARPVKQGVGVLGDCKSGQCNINKPHTLTCKSNTTLIPSLHPTHTATPTHHLTTKPNGVVNACPDVVLTTPSITCSFCRSVSGGGNTFTSLNLKAPLLHTMLEPISLLQCLGVTPPAGATSTDGVSLATLCQECHTLMCESDHAYHRLMEVKVGMKQRWAGLEARVPPVPATLQETNKEQAVVVATPVPTQCARRLRPILPKPSGPVVCGLCGAHVARLEEWHQHTATHHRLSPRWRSPRLLAALKVCLTKQLQQDNSQQDTQRCPACSHSFSQHEKFVEHLRDHHRVKVDKDFLACITGGAEGAWQWRGDTWLGKEEQLVKEEEELEEEEEIVEDEEMIEEEERIVKSEEQEREEEKEVGEEEVEEEEDLRGRVNSLLEKHQTESGLEECTKESGVRGMDIRQEQDGGGRGRGSRWRCRMCAAVFTSQQDHDTHKAATHPDTVRARRGTAQPVVPHQPAKKDVAHQDLEYPVVAYREGAIVILEGDGRGGVIHHRLQPTSTPEDLQDKAQQNTPSQTGAALSFPCPACTAVFGDPLSLVRHQRVAHKHTGPGDGVMLVECPVCGRRLASSPALRHHMARVHCRSSHPPLSHKCRLCLCQCHTRPQLERHMRERHGAPPLPAPVQCDQCGKTYSARYIDSHLANMHGDVARFPCTFCPMKFRAKTSLQGHMSLEHANTSWTCQECPLQFTKYHQLRQHHLYVHSKAEHRCPQCPRSFKRRCDLTEHTKRRHQERQPQECSFCPKMYSDRKRLRIHLMRKHNVAWEDTLAQGYARRQRENNCLRRRHQQQQHQPHSPQEKDHHHPREEGEETHGGMLGAQPDYSVVHLTESPHPLADSISYIILEEA